MNKNKEELIQSFNKTTDEALKKTADEKKRKRLKAVRDFAVREVKKLPDK